MILGRRERRRLLRDSSALFGLGLIALLVLFALVGPLALGDPNQSHFSLGRSSAGGPAGPSLAHPLGVDPLYRDVLARLASGARLSLGIALGATTLACGIGAVIGIVAAWCHGGRWRRIDDLLMRLVDVALAFPYLLLVTAIGVAIDRADAITVTLILGITSWTGVARVVRAKALQTKEEGFVLAARALGARAGHILRRHLLPAIAPTLLVIGSQAMGQMILAEAVLGYLTVGIEPPQPTWGRMLHEAESYLSAQPLLVAAPGIAIMVAVLGFARVGDGLRDAVDPHQSEPTKRRGYRFAADLFILGTAVVLLGFAEPDPVAAPRSAPTRTAEPQRGGTLAVATTVAVHSLDPALAYDEASRTIGDLVYATLITWDDAGRLVPDLAERIVVGDGGKRLRVHLRDGLIFHDGTPLRAGDVKRSLERTLHPKTPCPAAHLYAGIQGFSKYAEVPDEGLDGLVVRSERVLDILLREPDASFPSLLALGFAAPVCASGGLVADPRSQTPPCGAGPFSLKQLDRGERVQLARFEGYAGAASEGPYLDGVEWWLDMPARTQRYRFERGELHIITDLSGIDISRYAQDERWAPYRHWVTRPITHSIFMNTSMPPFDNRHLRRAVSFAVQPSVLEKVRPDVVEASRLIPASLPGPSHSPPMRHHDLERALEEMELAGHPYDPATGRGGYPKPIDYLTVPDTFEQAAAEVFQQQLAEVGLHIRLRLVSWASWLALISKPGEVAMGWRGWAADYPDPATFFEPLLTTAAIVEEGTQNVSFFSSPELDRVVANAHRELDWGARMALYDEAERIVRDEAPLVPVYSTRSLQLHQPRVHGYHPHPVIALRLRDVWLAAQEEP
jgi:ABC-type dipeptide/oligopeptide/nickel transport system permease subunit/ABC-type transport system substrate-binding protein